MIANVEKVEALALERFEREDYEAAVALFEVISDTRFLRPHVALAYVLALIEEGDVFRARRAFDDLDLRIDDLEASGRMHAALSVLRDETERRLEEALQAEPMAPTRIDRPEPVESTLEPAGGTILPIRGAFSPGARR